MSKSPPDPVHILHDVSGSVTALSTLKCGSKDEFLVSGSETGFISIWSLLTYRPTTSWSAHQTSILWLGSTDNAGIHLLVSYGRRESVKIWNTQNEALLNIPISHDCFCKCDIFGPMLVVPNEKNEVKIYNTNETTPSSNKKLCVSPDEGAIFIVKALTTSERILTAYESGRIFLWDLSSCTISCQTKIPHLPSCAEHNAEKHEIVIGTSSETIFVYEDKELKLLKEITLVNPGLNAIILRPTDRRLYASAGWDKRIRLFSAKTFKKLCVLNVHDGSVNALVYVYDKQNILLAAGGSDSLISLWNLYNDLDPIKSPGSS